MAEGFKFWGNKTVEDQADDNLLFQSTTMTDMVVDMAESILFEESASAMLNAVNYSLDWLSAKLKRDSVTCCDLQFTTSISKTNKDIVEIQPLDFYTAMLLHYNIVLPSDGTVSYSDDTANYWWEDGCLYEKAKK